MGIILYFVILMVVPMLAQMNVKSTFNKYSRVRSTSGLTGREVAEEIFGSMGGMSYSTADPMISFAENNPVSILAGIMIFAGVVMIIGGIILAWYLYRLGKQN